MKMKRSMATCFALVALAACSSLVNAQTVKLSLDLFYTDPTNPASRGSWELRATGSSEGIAGVDTQLSGIVTPTGLAAAVANSYFTAPTPAFKETFDTKPWNTDQDANPATFDALFGQVPVAAPGPQDLQYNVGKTGGDTLDRIGVVLAPPAGSTTRMLNNVLLAHGWFGANSTPAFVGGESAANVFTAQGTSTNPPAVGSIVEATVTTQVRTNQGGKKGDASLDNDVDVFQLGQNGDAQILTANLGKKGKGVLWQSGDFNGDGDVDVFQLGQQGDAQILTANLGSDAHAGEASASYNAADGRFILDIGTGIGVVGVQLPAGIDLLSTVSDARVGGGAPQQVDIAGKNFAYFNPNGIPAGIWDQGTILPAGLSQSTVDEIFLEYSTIGGGGGRGAIQYIPATVIPEPAAAMLVMFAAVGVASRRRVA